MISDNLTTWQNCEVQDYSPATPLEPGVIYRFRLEWEAEIPMAELFAAYTADPAAAETKGLVIGAWFSDDSSKDSSEIVELLVGARSALPKLEALFFGDVISEENEMSWINHTDISPVFSAYPGLKHFVVRGGSGLGLGGKMRLDALESLTIETGGMPVSALREVLSLDLPNLEKLELWLGTDNYGWDGNVADLKPLLDGGLFPKLKHLGLRNSEIADQIAEALITAPLVNRLESLDLSLGTLTDAGAEHLLKCEALKRVRLDLHHHYCSNEMMVRLQAAFTGVNLNEQESADEYGPYVSVGE